MAKSVLLENVFDLVVADTETLDRWDDAIVLSAALTHGDLRKPYTIEQLVEERTFFMKFDVKEQVQLGRKSDQGTIDWWKSDKTSDVAREVSYYPKDTDRSVRDFVREYEAWAHTLGFEPKSCIHTDRNLFDMRKLQHIIEVSLGETYHPWDYHDIEDLTTRLKAYTGDRYGNIDIRKLTNATYHDPRWDAAVDRYRLQAACVGIGLLELEA